jgi:hypothetical protein
MSAIDDPVNVASPEFLQVIDSIDPGVWGTPCAVTLRDGKHFDAAIAHENRRFGDAGDWINPQDILSVVASSKRMPARFARQLHEAGESGMGYHIYIVRLSDGSSFVHMAGNLGIDLVDLPPGYSPDDIVEVTPNAGREQRGYRQITRSPSIDYARSSERAQ